MRTIYIDNECKCHVAYSEGLREVADTTDFFAGKCDEFIEGFWFIPVGETHVINGIECTAMIAPWRDYDELHKVQQEYEKRLLAEYTKALNVMGVVI